MKLGRPRLHLRLTDSTNERARALALAGAPHGMLVTAEAQTAGRGRQGRTWIAPPRRALLCSLVIRRPPDLLPLRAGVAVAQTCGEDAALKWPNDVMLGGRKVAGVLIEGRAQEKWAVVGIGVNVALRAEDFPPELRDRAGGLGKPTTAVDPTLARVLERLEAWLDATTEQVLYVWRERDALRGRDVRWAAGSGRAVGIDQEGRLVVETAHGSIALEAGEVHLTG